MPLAVWQDWIPANCRSRVHATDDSNNRKLSTRWGVTTVSHSIQRTPYNDVSAHLNVFRLPNGGAHMDDLADFKNAFPHFCNQIQLMKMRCRRPVQSFVGCNPPVQQISVRSVVGGQETKLCDRNFSDRSERSKNLWDRDRDRWAFLGFRPRPFVVFSSATATATANAVATTVAVA